MLCEFDISRHASSVTSEYIPQALAYFLQGLALHSTAPYVAVFATAMATPFAGAGALAVFNVGSVLGQIITGFFTDRVPYTRVMLISALGCSLTSFLLWGFADRLVILFVFIVFFGAMVSGHRVCNLKLC